MSFIKGKVVDLIFKSQDGIIVKAECTSGHKFLFPLGFYFKFNMPEEKYVEMIKAEFEFTVTSLSFCRYNGNIIGTPTGTPKLEFENKNFEN